MLLIQKRLSDFVAHRDNLADHLDRAALAMVQIHVQAAHDILDEPLAHFR
jgi:hypothetical protein